MAIVPAIDSLVWWPARAILGDGAALLAVLAAAFAMLAASIVAVLGAVRRTRHRRRRRLGGGVGQRRELRAFRAASPKQMLRRKEWTLLLRDPWLASQTLMQLLYLLPPALMLWQASARGVDDLVLLVPVLVMAAGQLAGGLAWLAISGEDAPDLVRPRRCRRTGSCAPRSRRSRAASPSIFAPFVLAWRRLAARRASRRRRHCRRGAVGDPDPALVPHPGAAQAVPPPPDLLARRDLRGGVLVDRLGGTAGLAASGKWPAARSPPSIALGILAGARAISPRKST